MSLQESPLFDRSKHPHGPHGWFSKTGGLGAAVRGAQHGGEFIPTYSGKDLVFGKHAGGSNGARWAFHKGTGQRWLVKHYQGDRDRVATELLANAIYREMGARVPAAGKLRLNDGRTALTYPTLPGSPSPFVFHQFGPSEALGKHFMTDALVANWDVAGMEDDNVLWDEEGRPFRVDQGGTLEMRAMGGPKPFGPVPVEVSTMMAPGGQARRSMTVREGGMRRQAAEIAYRLTPDRIDRLVDEAPFRDRAMRERIRENLKARVAWMDRFSAGQEQVPRLQEDDWEWLAEAGGLTTNFHWDELQHPRDNHGKFRESLIARLKKGEKLALGKTILGKDKKTGTYTVTRSGKISKFHNRNTAVRAALDSSARGTEPGSVGGTTKYTGYNDYLLKHDVDPLDPGYMNGVKISDTAGLQNLLEQEQGHLADAEASDVQGIRNGIPTLKARVAELKLKIKKAGASPAASPGSGGPTGAAALEKLKALGYGPGAQFKMGTLDNVFTVTKGPDDDHLELLGKYEASPTKVSPEAFLGQVQGATNWQLVKGSNAASSSDADADLKLAQQIMDLPEEGSITLPSGIGVQKLPGGKIGVKGTDGVFTGHWNTSLEAAQAALASPATTPGGTGDPDVTLGMKLAMLPKGEYHALSDDLTIKKQDNGTLTVLSNKDGVLGVHGSALDAAHQALTHHAGQTPEMSKKDEILGKAALWADHGIKVGSKVKWNAGSGGDVEGTVVGLGDVEDHPKVEVTKAEASGYFQVGSIATPSVNILTVVKDEPDHGNPSAETLENDLKNLEGGDTQVLKNGVTIFKDQPGHYTVKSPGNTGSGALYGDPKNAAQAALDLDQVIGTAHGEGQSKTIARVQGLKDGDTLTMPRGTKVKKVDGLYEIHTSKGGHLQTLASPITTAEAADALEAAHAPAAAGVHVGDPLPDAAALDALPEGTVVGFKTGNNYTKSAAGWQQEFGSGVYTSTDFGFTAPDNPVTVKSLPAGSASAPGTGMTPDGIKQVIGPEWEGETPLTVTYADGVVATLTYHDDGTYELSYSGKTKTSQGGAGAMAQIIAERGPVTSITDGLPVVPSETGDPIKSTAQMDALPVGSQVGIAGDSGNYTKLESGQWEINGHSYPSNSFPFNQNYVIKSVGPAAPVTHGWKFTNIEVGDHFTTKDGTVWQKTSPYDAKMIEKPDGSIFTQDVGDIIPMNDNASVMPASAPAPPAEPLKKGQKISGKDAIAALPVGAKVKVLQVGMSSSHYSAAVYTKAADGNWILPGGIPAPLTAVDEVKIYALPKPIKGMQANAGGHKLKDLDIAVGDVIQYKKGGWKYTVIETKPAGGVKVQAANGTTKLYTGLKAPALVQKADGSHLAAKPVPTGPEPKIGDKLLDASGLPFTIDSIVDGTVHATFDNGYKMTFPLTDAKSHLESGAWKTNTGGPAAGIGSAVTWNAGSAMNPSPQSGMIIGDNGSSWKVKNASGDEFNVGKGFLTSVSNVKPSTAAELKAKLKEPTGSTPVMKNLPDGTVIATPAGQVGVLKPSEDAYTGYVAAYDVATGQKFEPPASKHPSLYSTDPAVMAQAAATLTANSGVSQVTVASSGGGSATTSGPPPVFAGALTHHHASAQLAEWQDEAHLTSAQRAAIGSYTGSSKSINSALRNSTGVMDEATAQRAKDMQAAMTAVVQEPTVIVRKTNLAEWTNAKPGQVVHDNGFFSTSWDPGAISTGGVYSGAGDAPIEVHVLLQKGDHFVFAEHAGVGLDGEREVILPAFSLFKVLKSEKSGGVTRLYVETF